MNHGNPADSGEEDAMKLINLEQGSKQWLYWRLGGLGGSDAPIIMGTSPWKTVEKLFDEKLGAPRDPVGPWQQKAMDRGNRLEPVARRIMENMLQECFANVCGESDEHPWMRLSSDGMSMDGAVMIEIKCPGKKDHAIAKAGKVPDKYVGQLQHSLAVGGADLIIYGSYRPEEDKLPVLIEVRPDHAYISELIEREGAFWKAVQDQDYSIYDSVVTGSLPDGFFDLAGEWIDLQRQLAVLAEREQELKSVLFSCLSEGHNVLSGCGIEVSRSPIRGSIDYKKAVKSLGASQDYLERYRKPASDREVIKLTQAFSCEA
jgi:putative phage-type endonuclease